MGMDTSVPGTAVTIEQVRQRLAELGRPPESAPRPLDMHALNLAREVASGTITLADKAEEQWLLAGLLEHMKSCHE